MVNGTYEIIFLLSLAAISIKIFEEAAISAIIIILIMMGLISLAFWAYPIILKLDLNYFVCATISIAIIALGFIFYRKKKRKVSLIKIG
jgi:predicted membrane channel-forming protein YqfA (hemolysin III family)